MLTTLYELCYTTNPVILVIYSLLFLFFIKLIMKTCFFSVARLIRNRRTIDIAFFSHQPLPNVVLNYTAAEMKGK